MKSYEVILFDLDGTITDSSEGITNSVKYMLKQYGIEENDMDKLCQFIGPPLVEPLQEMYGFSEDEAIKAVAQYRVYYKAGTKFIEDISGRKLQCLCCR